MGHAGAIISGSAGTADAKREALEGSAASASEDADRDRRRSSPRSSAASAAIAVQLRNRERDATPFTTKDGSTIREYLHTDAQSLAEASLDAGQSTQRHYHARSEEIYLIVAGEVNWRSMATGESSARATRSSSRRARGTS